MTAVEVGVGHGADIPLLFQAPGGNVSDMAVGHIMLDYWQNFVTNGNPNGQSHHPIWPPFSHAFPSAGNITMLLKEVPCPVPKFDLDPHCGYWAASHPVPYATA